VCAKTITFLKKVGVSEGQDSRRGSIIPRTNVAKSRFANYRVSAEIPSITILVTLELAAENWGEPGASPRGFT
jgi:hypothetical protein